MSHVPTTTAPMTATIEGHTLPVDAWVYEPAPVTYARSEHAVMPDPTWRHVDSNRHIHRWALTDRTEMDKPESLPSLRASTVHVDCDGSCDLDDCEGYDQTVYHCVVCGDPVEPGYVPDRRMRDVGEPIVTGWPSATVTLLGGRLPGVTWGSVHEIVVMDGDERIEGRARLDSVKREGDGQQRLTFHVELPRT